MTDAPQLGIVQTVISGSIVALGLKAAAAGLSFVTFLLAARVLDSTQFGFFGIAFSTATLLVLGGSLGQRLLMLKFVPVYQERGDGELAAQLIGRGYTLVFGGVVSLGLLYLLLSRFDLGHLSPNLAIATVGLAIVLALVEFQAHVLRGFGRILAALLLRDVLWHLASLAIFGAAIIQVLSISTATELILFMAVVLALGGLSQWALEPSLKGARLGVGASIKGVTPTWNRAARAFWSTSLVRAATANLAVVLVGIYLSVESAAQYFAAFRLAIAVNLVTVGANILCRPLLSRAFERKNTAEASVICSVITTFSSFIAIALIAIFWFAGSDILGFFSPDFSLGNELLLILATGYLLKVLVGPASAVLQMMNQEELFLRLSLVTSGLALALLIPMTALFGARGAAVSVAFELAATASLAAYLAWRRVGINTTITALLRLSR
ncbi:MAG: hypothetical protein CNF01_02535 [Halieaceae bacterium MED-G27]|nr:MAG: hypothetical protein CNF01_02535 [Halieaceae bacterium MED-G27]|tara:strand:- start:6846 stop:8162 length:1317 start_codon:yes stop_codon:yes gene_type:complete